MPSWQGLNQLSRLNTTLKRFLKYHVGPTLEHILMQQLYILSNISVNNWTVLFTNWFVWSRDVNSGLLQTGFRLWKLVRNWFFVLPAFVEI